MTEREILLNATAALLLICLLGRHPAVKRRLRGVGLRLVVAGSLIPLLDPVIAYLTSEDRLAQLARPPLFLAPFYGLLLIGAVAVLAAFLVAPRRAVRLGLGLAAGYGVHLALRLVTPAGVPLLAPFVQERVALPILPVGQPLLVAVLIAGLLAMEVLPAYGRWVWRVTATLAVVYGAAGAVAAGVLYYQAARVPDVAGALDVYPVNAWLTRWMVVEEMPQAYRFHRWALLGRAAGEAEQVPRWDDQPMLVKLLGNPVVRRFYYHVFHHPVVRIETTSAQVTLLMQELQDQSPRVPGPTFYLESDLAGRDRFYQLQRFD